MGYFYFTRHGQTIWNVENKICGATDIALTDIIFTVFFTVYNIYCFYRKKHSK